MKLLQKTVAVIALCVLSCGCAAGGTHDYNDISVSTGGTVSKTQQQATSAAVTETDGYSTETEISEDAASAETTEQEEMPSQAQLMLSEMTLEEKVGQMILATCPLADAAEEAASYSLGGYLMFAYDFMEETPDSVRERIASFQSASDIPMLIAVDEEGGDILRISKFSQYADAPFGSPMELYESGGVQAVLDDAQAKCELLLSLGVNTNLAPVCDLPRSEWDYIYDRTFGTDCEVTCECIAALTGEMNSNGLVSSLKHFPGYGNNVDTHTGIATDERTLEEFRELDLRPFSAGIDAGAPCVMVSHNIVNCMDDSLPASLSPEVHRLLREELGFDGVIMTDELTMGAIREFTAGEDPAVAAVKAGNDLLCIAEYAEAISAILSAVQRGDITEARIDESVLRILDMKIDFGIIR